MVHSPPFPLATGSDFFRYDFQPDRRRLCACYTGLWTEQITRNALNAFRKALESASKGGQPLTLMDDFRDWPVQRQEVTKLAGEFEMVSRLFPIRRNALVIPSAETRIQVRRTLTVFNLSKLFQTYDDADRWLAEAEQEGV